MWSFSPTIAPKSLSTGLLSIISLPNLLVSLGLPQPRCRPLHFALLNFALTHLSSMSRSLWMAKSLTTISWKKRQVHSLYFWGQLPESPVWLILRLAFCLLFLPIQHVKPACKTPTGTVKHEGLGVNKSSISGTLVWVFIYSLLLFSVLDVVIISWKTGSYLCSLAPKFLHYP